MAKQLEEMRIRPSDNGGHMVFHEYKRETGKRGGQMSGGMYMERPKTEEHIFGAGEGQKMLAHVTQHLGMGGKGAKEASGDCPDCGGKGCASCGME